MHSRHKPAAHNRDISDYRTLLMVVTVVGLTRASPQGAVARAVPRLKRLRPAVPLADRTAVEAMCAWRSAEWCAQVFGAVGGQPGGVGSDPNFVSVAGRCKADRMSEDELRRTLGINGPTVPAVALGCSSMSGLTGAGEDDQTAAATIRAAVDHGVCLIDTADFYGMGHNELLLANALAGIDRDRYLISDKFGGLRDPTGAFLGTDCRPATVKNFLAYSLQRLGADYVDIYRPLGSTPTSR